MKRLMTAVVTSAFALTLGSLAAKAETVLTYSSWIPWTHPINTNLYIPWMEDIERESNGSIKFKRLPKSVGHPRAHLDAVRTGQIGAAMSVHGYSPKRFASYLFSELPMLGDTAVGTSIALQRTHEKYFGGKNFYEGTHLIGLNTHGPGVIHHSKKFINTPADMAGQKMRTGGPVPLQIVKAWGGVPIRQPAPKSYEILSTGVADGITFPFESLSSFKITKLVPFSTYIPGGLYSSSFYLVISKSKYDAMSAADKAVIDKHSGETFSKRAGEAWDKINREGKEKALAAGNKIQVASGSMVDAVKKLKAPLEAEYLKGAAGQGTDGAAVLSFFMSQVNALAK
jgi:TRAP-type transport system periplasmic protein